MIKIFCVYGLTGTGKTEYAVKLAKKINGYCLSADSRQWYQGSPVGTNQPQGKMVAPKGIWKKIIKDAKYLEIKGVPYLTCNTWQKKRAITAMDFKKYCLGIISRQQKYAPDLTPILVGGTGLYIQVIINAGLLKNLSKPTVRERKRLQKLSVAELQKKLQKLSLTEYKKLADPKNPHRLIRAIEKHSINNSSPFSRGRMNSTPWQSHGVSGRVANRKVLAPPTISLTPQSRAGCARRGFRSCGIKEGVKTSQNLELKTLNFEPHKLWLKKDLSPEIYKKQIALRTNQMLKNGWIAEVKNLLKNSPRHPLLTGIGYRDIVNFIQNKITKNELVQKINTAMWQYARRQKNYFKNQL